MGAEVGADGSSGVVRRRATTSVVLCAASVVAFCTASVVGVPGTASLGLAAALMLFLSWWCRVLCRGEEEEEEEEGVEGVEEDVALAACRAGLASERNTLWLCECSP
jgi:hypothetical protein